MQRRNETLVETKCSNPGCTKPVLVDAKDLKHRWGRDRYHKECYRKVGTFNRRASKMFDL